MLRIITIIVSFTIIAFTASAQEKKEISKDVKVVKAYTPSLSDAFKVNRMPVLKDSVGLKPKFNYSILSKAMITGYSIEPITPARLAKGRQEKLKTSYLKAGFGNYGSLWGDLNYNILQSEKFVLGINAGHWSSFGDIKLEDGEKVDAPFHDTWANLGFDYLFSDKTLYTNIDFKHNIYNYYGYKTIDPQLIYWVPGAGSNVKGDLLMPDVKQRLASFDFQVGFKNNEIKDDDVQYDASFTYLSFSNLTGVSQNGFKLSGDAYFPFGTVGFAVDLDLNYYGTSVPDSIGPLYSFQERNNTVIGLMPRMVFNFDRARIDVGLLLFGEIDSFDGQFQVAPVLTGKVDIVEGVVSLEGGLKGKYNQNDYRTVQYENPFVSPDQNVKSAFYGLDVFAKLKGNFSKSTSFGFDFSYAMFADEHFYVNKSFVEPGVIQSLAYTNLFVPVYDDGSLLTVSGEILYKPDDKFSLLAKATYYGWNLDSLSRAWHKPDIEFVLKSRFSPVKNLWVDGGVNVLGKRYAFDPATLAEKKLSAVFDLNLGAEYIYNSTWSFFGGVNNLASSKYYQWNGYPMQGINVHVGVGISF